MFSLSGRTALVVGGSRGIGAATVRALHAAGAKVAFSYVRAKDEAAALAKEVDGARSASEGEAAVEGRGTIALQADLADPANAPALVRQAAQKLGRLDVLVFNAGENVPKPFLDITHADLKHQDALNYEAAFLATQEAARILPQGGRVVLMGSIAGVLARPGSVAYGASKAALHSLARSAAEALAPRGISVNAVAPGMVDTGTHPAMMTPEFVERVSKQVPLGRFATSEEIAQCVLFFAAGPAYVTGQVLVVDGGIGNVYFR